MRRSLPTALSLLVFSSAIGRAADDDARHMQAVRVQAPIRIDGDLSDPAWAAASPQTGFTQRFPHTGQPASFATRVRVVYDDRALYVAAELDDPEPDRINARVTRRDRWIESDWFTFHVDSRHDRRTGFFFAVNAAGVMRDGIWYDEMMGSEDWDGVWQAAARLTATGWVAELRIPLKLLRYRAGDDVTMGINFERWISRLNEGVYWQHIPPANGLWISRFGVLSGLVLPTAPVRIEVVPYAAARPSLDDDAAATSRPLEIGVDGKLGLGTNLMLTWSLNPDFGQVEVDQVVLNLSTYETYFPEKRPFFLEDQSLFRSPEPGGATMAQVFYTRRIGRVPRSPSVADDEEILRDARLPRIYGAAKLAGQTDGRLKIGFLQAVTSREDALVGTPGGGAQARLAEPLSSWSILRLRQDFLRHSSVGLMATALATPDDGAALTGEADLELELFDDEYRLTLLGFYSYLSDQRFTWQDEYVEQALQDHGAFGYGGHAKFAKTGGDHLVGSVSAFYYSPNLALNDVGYLDRADRFMAFFNVRHHRKKPLGPLARYAIQLSGWIDRNADFGVNLGDGFNLDAWVDFVDGWYAGAWYFSGLPLCDDRETRTAGAVSLCGQDHRHRVGAWLNSPSKHAISAGLDFNWRTTEHGQGLGVYLPLTANPHPRLELQLQPGYTYKTGDPRWLETVEEAAGDRFLFGDQHAETWNVTLRGTFTFTTELTLQAYAQIFLASVDHTRKYAASPTGSRIKVARLADAPDVADDYDFTATSLNLYALLRWEFLPGSIFYLVYTGAIGDGQDLADFRFAPVLGDLLRTDARHLLMLKLTWYWG